MNLRDLTKTAERKAAQPIDEGAEIARAAKAKEAKEDRAHHYAIIGANARERTVTFQRRYRADGESRTTRERVAPAHRVTGRELLSLCREAVRLGSYRLERKGMRISDDDRLDAVAELCARILSEGTVEDADKATLPRRERLGKTYMRDRAAGIVLDAFRARSREELTDEWEGLETAVINAEGRADNAPDPYLADATMSADPAATYLRDAARELRLWPHSAEEAALLHASQPAVPSDQWAGWEAISASAYRTRISTGRKALSATEPGALRAAIQNADEVANGSPADDVERERAELEALLIARPR
jgi:hypothetical protein